MSRHLKDSIVAGLADREAAIAWLLRRGGALNTPERVSEYLDMYANQRTVDYGPEGRRGIRVFLDRCHEAGLLPKVTVDYAP